MEEWRSIIGFESAYEVSSLGRIRRTIGTPGTWAGRILNPGNHPMGYKQVCLHFSGDKRRTLVHIIVAEAFIGPKPDGHGVNHKNGIKSDNRAENLEWATQHQNVHHAMDILGFSNAGERHGLSKFTVQDVIAIRSLRQRGRTLNEIADQFDCTFQHVSSIVLRKCWKHVP